MPKKKRASNGMGSVRRRSDGRWEGRYSAPDGRQHSVYGRTEKECTARLRAAQRDVDSGAWKEPSRMTVGEWLDIWLGDYLTHASELTIIKYRGIVAKYIKPELGPLKMEKLSPLHVQRMVKSMQKTLEPGSIQNYTRIFGAAMTCAINAGVIQSNPAEKVKLPRPAPAKLHIIDRADIPGFIDAAKKGPYENELIIMLFCGLRLGEVKGLRWGDIDLDAATMHIQRQLHPSTTKKRITPPKYGETRLIHLPPEAVEVLRAQKRKQAEQHLAAGADWVKDDLSADLVFRQPNGRAHGDSTLYNAVKAAGKAIGMPDLHPHDLRHSYAVAALRSGADIKTVQHNLGHRSAAMTLDVYAAYTSDAGKKGAEKLSDYLKNVGK